MLPKVRNAVVVPPPRATPGSTATAGPAFTGSRLLRLPVFTTRMFCELSARIAGPLVD